MKNLIYLAALLLAGCATTGPTPRPATPPTPPPLPRAIIPPMPGTTLTESAPLFRAASAIPAASVRSASFAPASVVTNRVRKPIAPTRKLVSINLSTTNGSYRIEHSAEIVDQNWVPFIFVGGWPGVSIIEQSGSPYGFYRAVQSSNPSNAPTIFR